MTAQPVSPDLARAAWAAVEPLHTLVYFVPEAAPAYEAIGLEPVATAYFASRSAALGAVGAETVAAAFYVFSPDLIRMSIPKAWTAASPETVLDTRLGIVDQALRRILGEEAVRSQSMEEAAGIARTAAEEAARHIHGRSLFAGHAGLPWPAEPHLVLWHAATLLREFRGDGHISVLLSDGLGPVEALVDHAAAEPHRFSFLRKTRGWPQEAWDAATDRLVRRGLVETGEEGALSLTGEGQKLRADREARTDALSLPAFTSTSPDDCTRLIELITPFTDALSAEGVLPPGTRHR